MRPWPVYGPTRATRSPPIFRVRTASDRIRLENHAAFRPLGCRPEPIDGLVDHVLGSRTTCSGRGPRWTLVLTRNPLLPNYLQSVTWEEAPLKGESPEARSGHTLTVVDTKAYLLGGTGRKDGKCSI